MSDLKRQAYKTAQDDWIEKNLAADLDKLEAFAKTRGIPFRTGRPFDCSSSIQLDEPRVVSRLQMMSNPGLMKAADKALAGSRGHAGRRR